MSSFRDTFTKDEHKEGTLAYDDSAFFFFAGAVLCCVVVMSGILGYSVEDTDEVR